MEMNFLRKEWIAVALAQAKKKILGEDFVSILELNQFSKFLQTEFNNKKLNIIITRDLPNSEGFEIKDGIIVVPRTWNICLLSEDYQSILSNEQLFIDFFIAFENKKIERLKESKRKKLSI